MSDAVLASMVGFVAILDKVGVLRRTNRTWARASSEGTPGPLASVTPAPSAGPR